LPSDNCPVVQKLNKNEYKSNVLTSQDQRPAAMSMLNITNITQHYEFSEQ